MLTKVESRDIVIYNKKQFAQTGDNKYIFMAAVYYGIYRAINGVKLIPLPPFTDKIYTTVYKLAIIKLKFGNILSRDVLDKSKDIILEDFTLIKDIEYIKVCDKAVIKVFTTNKVFNIQIKDDLSAILSELAVIILKESGVSLEENMAYEIIYTGISEIRRRANDKRS